MQLQNSGRKCLFQSWSFGLIFILQFSAYDYHWPSEGVTVDQVWLVKVITALTFFFPKRIREKLRSWLYREQLLEELHPSRQWSSFYSLSFFFLLCSCFCTFLFPPPPRPRASNWCVCYKLTLLGTCKTKWKRTCFCCKANMELKLYFQVNLKSSWLLPWFWL